MNEKVTVSADQILLLRLRSQELIRRSAPAASSPAQVLWEVCGIQAQDLPAARLALHVRDEAISLPAIEQARQVERTIVRTWGMRGTLHLFAAEDARWLVPFLGPVFTTADRRRRTELGWDDERSARGLRILRDAIDREGDLTREEISRLLEADGLPHEGQAPIHLIFQAAMEALLCEGAGRGSRPTYVSFKGWVGAPQPLPRETALGELARRYLAAYSPASQDDFARWSGLKAGDARDAWQLLRGEIEQVETTPGISSGATPGALWILKSQKNRLVEFLVPQQVVRLLPGFDNYLLGYAQRDLFVNPRYARRINAGGGIIHPTLIINGRTLGTWKTIRHRASLEVNVDPFEPLPDELLPGLEREANRIGQFLGSSTILRVTEAQQ